MDTDSTTFGSTTAWFNCHAGVAGDMLLAALVDAGADRDEVAAIVAGLQIGGYAIAFEDVQRCGVRATWANVVTDDPVATPTDHAHRPARAILDLLASSDLPTRVRNRSIAVFERLAAVEGAIHGIDPADVELHEVGAVDSIIDVVGVCAALESLGIDTVRCSSIGLGSGTVATAHGVLPHPAPATIALIAAAGAPTHGLATTLETATPTGVALMTTLADGFGSIATGTPAAVGYGAGTADPAERANVVQVVVSRAPSRRTTPAGTAGAAADDDPGAEVTLLEANLDDVSPEVLAHTVDRLLAAGAHDAWLTPIVMKKGRPAHTISVLCDPSAAARLRGVVVRESGTLGVRAAMLRRWPQRRRDDAVDVDGHAIGVKIGDHRVKVEFDDAARAAAALGIPVRTVLERATALAAELTPETDDEDE